MAMSDSHHWRMKVSVAEAKNRLPALIRAVEDGQSITICRRGTPVVDIVRARRATGTRPTFGSLKHKVVIHDPDWWKPMTGRELDALLDGRR
jgi:prevent-host-death family protein